MIRSFACKETNKIWNRIYSKKLPKAIQKSARRKLIMLNNAQVIEDLRVPPCNRMEALLGNLSGKYSIRINEQWRIVFGWNNGDAVDVEIIDDH